MIKDHSLLYGLLSLTCERKKEKFIRSKRIFKHQVSNLSVGTFLKNYDTSIGSKLTAF